MRRRRIDPAEAQASDVISYVHPTERQVRHHRVQRREELHEPRRGMDGLPIEKKPPLRVCFLPVLHPHERATTELVWVPIEDVIHARRDGP